ncbi:hypothetical protein BI344_08505 [Chromobacterium sphagni]|uniref:Bacterial toxin YdaT domain-containing protein n=2 Tax=Chromobacterium sphagni TaxID=1903179 RepID=A0ABX3CDX7_9NEIS|nr:hypothetical protein BI344_08505 [Chromobacterium sphagni]
MNCMRHSSHKTPIAVIRDYVDLWRKQEGLSRQAAAARMVETYLVMGFERVWPIDFMVEGDAYQVLKANSDRIWRWLDDQMKEKNLLNCNAMPVVLMTLPLSIRLQCLTELLAPLGMVPAQLLMHEPTGSHAALMMVATKETGLGLSAFAALAEDMTREQLTRARAGLSESISANAELLRFVDCALAQPAEGR